MYFKNFFEVVKNIKSITITVDGKVMNYEVPCRVEYNQSWNVSHNCNCENNKIHFSRNENHNWNFINQLFSRFYPEETLEVIASCIPSLKIYKSEKSPYVFLTKKEFNTVDAGILQIPQVNFNYYKCDKCNTDFLCRISVNNPIPPDRGFPDGMPGLLMIHEVIELKNNTHLSIIEYLD